MESKLSYLLKSRKFWAVVLAVMIIAGYSLLPHFPLSSEQVSYLVYVLIAYIIGTAIEDQGKGAGSPLPPLDTPSGGRPIGTPERVSAKGGEVKDD